ncbi:MAG: peptide ABC transporter substrate-binding protein [Spirochaetes bacterium]|nr:peptide ABC transporter substrate-binding protein [Spirochaetota bacterium]
MRRSHTVTAAAFLLAGVLAAGAQDFTIVNGAEIQNLDPQAIESVQEYRICSALFEGLLVPDPETGAPLPGVAESWSFSPDFKTITFKLRKTTWSDGVLLTAATVAASWLRKMDPRNAFPYADLPALAIEGGLSYLAGKAGPEGVKIKVVDDQTLEVGLTTPLPQFPSLVLHHAFSIVPMHLVERYGSSWSAADKASFNGPFILKEWLRGSRLVLTPNFVYWDKKSVGLKSLTFLPTEDPDIGYNLYKSGAADWISRLSLEGLSSVRAMPDFHESIGYGVYYFLFNLLKPPFTDLRVRQALSLGIDKGVIAAAVPGGAQTAASSFVPPSEGYNPAKISGFDPTAAKVLLAEAGYPGGAGFPSLKLLYNSNETNKRVAEAARDQWKANLGIEIGLQAKEWNAYMDLRSGSRSFDLARASWVADYLDPSVFMDMWVTGSLRNDSGYSSPAYDQLMRTAESLSGSARLAVLAQAERLIADEAAVLPLFFYVDRNMIDLSRWDGWYANPLDQHPWKFIQSKQK